MRTILLVSVLLAGLVAAPTVSAASEPATGPDVIEVHPCFRPGTFNVIVLGRQTGCIGLPPETAAAMTEARPELIEVYPCFRPGTYSIVVVGIVNTGCIG